MGTPCPVGRAWYAWCSWHARGTTRGQACGAGMRHTTARACPSIPGVSHPDRARLPGMSRVGRGPRRLHGAIRRGMDYRGGHATACPVRTLHATSRSAGVFTGAAVGPIRFCHRNTRPRLCRGSARPGRDARHSFLSLSAGPRGDRVSTRVLVRNRRDASARIDAVGTHVDASHYGISGPLRDAGGTGQHPPGWSSHGTASNSNPTNRLRPLVSRP
jgi:hypothetical protein